MKNIKIILSSYPSGMPTEDNFEIHETNIPQLKDQEFLVKTYYLSVDPFLRMLMNPSDTSNAPSRDEGAITDLGQVMAGGNLGEVIKSKNKKFPEGSIVEGMLGWQSHPITNGWVNKRHNPAGIVICNPSLNVPISAFASILGRAGLTAFFCITKELKPKENETVVISAAAGAGGSLAGQIAKQLGCYVVGICGSDSKVEYITNELGFDIGINYKKNNIDLYKELKKACPKGIDVHYDNVGGEIMKSIAKLHNPGHRYRLVGIISEYNSVPENKSFWSWPYEKPMFVIHDYTKQFGAGIEILSNWINEGKIKYHEDIIHGIENTPKAFIGMLNGDNIGKRLVKI